MSKPKRRHEPTLIRLGPTFAPVTFNDDGEANVDGLPYDEIIGADGSLYMRRHYLTADRTHRLHHIHRSDADRELHDHPWDFTSVLLTGAYIETTTSGDVRYQAPAVLARRAETLHRLTLLNGPMWTYVVTGPTRRAWGFQTDRGWVHWTKFSTAGVYGVG